MANNNGDKLISGLTARKYLKCTKERFESLVEQGIIQAHRDEEMRWRVSKDSVLGYLRQRHHAGETRLVLEDHYQEVVMRICAAKKCIRIMTGDFKRFRLKPTAEQGENYNDGTPFIQRLIEKAEQGVKVQIVLSKPSANVGEDLKEYFRQRTSYPLDTRNCIRNHAKVVIIDDEMAYIGSANVTPAGLGQGVRSPGNFEAGILTENPEIIASLNAHFAKVWNGDYCDGCHRTNNCVEY